MGKLGMIIFILFISCISNVSGSYLRHELIIILDPETYSIDVTDTITVPESAVKSEIHFLLHGDLEISISGNQTEPELTSREPSASDFGFEESEFQLPEYLPIRQYSLKPPDGLSGEYRFTVHYGGKIHHAVEETAEEYARSFRQTPGIISEEGVYLSGASFWVPWFDTKLVTFDMTCSLPETWKAVSQGTRMVNETENARHTVRWLCEEPMDDIYLIAGQFSETGRQSGKVTVYAFLRTLDEALAGKYLETTIQYLNMYEELIGPYPYTKFALVENFWETGYGMPSFTLLGPRIIRFPFILHSSYPHELLHNWWGNSVFVDYDTGNWCEGLTVYLADHLIKEQQNLGVDYRRSTLQKYTDYVNTGNDFPLTEFRSRHHAPSEAVGYGKSMMVNHMLRLHLGDEVFKAGLRKFYRDNRFRRAAYADLQKSFEQVSGQDLEWFFNQWITRTGAPQLALGDISCESASPEFHLTITLNQVQPGDVYSLKIPFAVHFADGGQAVVEMVEMNGKVLTVNLNYASRPVWVEVDPEFDVFRKLHRNEIPPALSQAFGAENILIVLPSQTDTGLLEAYRNLAETWTDQESDRCRICLDNELDDLPGDRVVWLFGDTNRHIGQVQKGLAGYDVALNLESIRFGRTIIERADHSFMTAVRNPQNPDRALVWLSTDRPAALAGLGRKLPHYGKYSYLAFEGDEPVNIAKGQWPAVDSPMKAAVRSSDGTTPVTGPAKLPVRKALAYPAPVFSEKRMMEDIRYLAGEELKGRGYGSEGLDKAAEYLANRFAEIGLQPGGDDGGYFQVWNETGGEKPATLRNVIGFIPGNRPEWEAESVVVCAHYDHLGLGWPDVHVGNEGKIHPGADDNASGVAAMLDLARVLNASFKPDRTVVFAAFTGEENRLKGSAHYIDAMQRFPHDKIIGAINLDSVGRMNGNKLLILNGSSAREWTHLFMGAGFVTGVDPVMVTEELDASDQVSFIRKGIPAVQIFTGPHSDYHRPGDTPDKINSAGLVKTAAFAREAIVYLAGRDQPLTSASSAPAPEDKGAAGRTPRKTATGVVPDFSYSGKGVRLSDVTEGSAAEKAGMTSGDIIIGVGDHPVTNLRDYSNILKQYNPGDTAEILYLRGDTEHRMTITFTER
ncbi:M20/M25/M40 family metallo-hydrolase [bacterium]|nr:M20/M25/M40 family metallo-hydrolase [candidate division CSSED10-310 bacterium]